MARCQCAGGSCSCQIVGANGTRVTGSGTASSPYVVDASVFYQEMDSNNASEGFLYPAAGASVGDRAVIHVYARSNVAIRLPENVPDGTQFDIMVRHLAAAGQPQWTIDLAGGIDYWMTGPTLPGPDATKPTWYTCVKVNTNNWYIKALIAAVAP